MSRYQRQIQMAEIDIIGQEKLAHACVVVVGAGGLGHPVLSYLAGAGVGQIHIVDHDKIEVSNLHRQPLFNQMDVGQLKAQVAAQRIRQNNSEIDVFSHEVRLDPANVVALCGSADVVVDAADSFAVTYCLSDFCRDQNIGLISSSVLGFEGYVGGFCGGVAPSVRAVFEHLPQSGQNCASAGVSGPAVGVMGSMQAQMVLNILLDIKPSPLGQMVKCDFKTFGHSRFSFLNAPEPTAGFKFISTAQIEAKDRVIELRSTEESLRPLVPHAHRLAMDEVDQLEADGRRTIVVCRTGLRAWNAAIKLQQRGQDKLVLVAVG